MATTRRYILIIKLTICGLSPLGEQERPESKKSVNGAEFHTYQKLVRDKFVIQIKNYMFLY